MVHAEMLLDGCFVGGPCDQSVGKTLSRSPWDGRAVATAAEGDWTHLNLALDAATDAAIPPLSERRHVLSRTADLLTERREELADLMVGEIGKPISLALAEVDRCAVTFRLAAEHPFGSEEVPLGPDARAGVWRAEVARFPLGPVLAIVPYNWPLNLAAHKIAPALLVGAPVIVKPSPLAPASTMELVRIVHEAGAASGSIGVWHGPDAWVRRACGDPRVAVVSFTGSARVGAIVREAAGAKPVLLELGGQAAAIVAEDADLDLAARRIAFGAFAYAGQICISVQHVVAHRSVFAELRERLRAVEVPTGDPADPATVCGPMISVEAADRVRALAGIAGEGTLAPPTWVEDAPEGAPIRREEAFGPVATLDPYDDEAELAALPNGIQAGLFTRDPERVRRLYGRLPVGGLVANDAPTLRFDAVPYGGFRDGAREGVGETVRAFTGTRSLLFPANFPWHPASDTPTI